MATGTKGLVKLTAAMLVALAAACGGTSTPPGPTCRGYGEACAATADCCSSYVCDRGACARPSTTTCQDTGLSCSSDGECCSGLACTSGICAPRSTCKSSGQACGAGATCCAGLTCTAGVCHYGSKCSAATCATGCCDASGLCRLGIVNAACGKGGGACSTCAGGETCTSQRCQPTAPACSGQGQPCGPGCCGGLVCYAGVCGENGMTWTMTNQYGSTVDLAFFDRAANLEWPGNGNVYYVTNGQTLSYDLACALGRQICYGAADPNDPNGGDWGVGINDQHGCMGCCALCDGQTHAITLTP